MQTSSPSLVGSIALLNTQASNSMCNPFVKNVVPGAEAQCSSLEKGFSREGEIPISFNYNTKAQLCNKSNVSNLSFAAAQKGMSSVNCNRQGQYGDSDRTASPYATDAFNDNQTKTSSPNVLKRLLTKEKVKRDRKVLHPQAKELILNVVNFMKQEANGVMEIPLKKVQCRAAKATGFSERTVRRIVKESKELPVTDNPNGEGSSVSFPPKKIPNRPKPKTGLDVLTRCAVRRIIHRIYVNERTVPTIKKIHQQLIKEIGFKGGSRSAHKIVKDLGFYWKKTKAKSQVLMEKHDIRLKRIEYLRDIKKMRHEGKIIVYVAHMLLPSGRGNNDNVSVLTAGSIRGFAAGSLLLHTEGQSNLTPRVAAWVRDTLFPTLPSAAVVVFDGAAFRNSNEKMPSLDSDTETMRNWLTSKAIPFHPEMLRPELHQIIRKNAGRIKKNKSVVEQVLIDAGHSVLQIPPDHPDLNPAALILADTRHTVAEKIGATNGTAADVVVLAERRLSELGTDSWATRCDHVRTVEQEYLASEGIVDAEVERLLSSSKETNYVAEECEDPQENNINFVRHFMGGLLGLDEQKLHSG